MSAMLSMAPSRGVEHLMLDTARRLARQPAGWVVLIVHLSRMFGARPHHRRIGRAILQDVALRHDGQVFSPRNGDLVLLCRETPPGLRAYHSGLEPQQLPATFERLLRADSPIAERLTSAWALEADTERLVAYATARQAESVAVPPDESEDCGQTASIDLLATRAADLGIDELMHRQTAVLLLAGRPRPDEAAAAGAIRPLFTELSYAIAAIEARAGIIGQATADPFLFRHLAGRLDHSLLAAMATQLGAGTPLDALRQRLGGPPLHLNMTLPTVLSDSFACVAAAAHAAGAALGIEVAFAEACADPAAFSAARRVLRQYNVALTLDGISHLSLCLAQPWALGPDLVKLDWSARLPGLPAVEQAQIGAALARVGLHRVVLHQADSEAALRWGLALGIRRFQGRHVDAMLGAARLVACPDAEHCALRQCAERGTAVAAAGRVGCRNHALLDAAAP